MAKLHGLTIADIHFGKKDDAKLYAQLKKYFITKIKKEGNKLDYVIVAGDLFDRILKLNELGSILAIKFMLELIELSVEYGFVVRVLKGTKTHDFNQLNNFKYLEAKHHPRFRIIETVEEEEIVPEVFFLYLPEEYVANPEEYYKPYFELEDGIKYDMIFFHGTFDFIGFVPDIESERHVKNAPIFKLDQISNIVYGKALGGHIHTRFVENKVEYTSSFTRTCFGEEKPKGFLEVFYDTETLKCTTKFIENEDAPIYITFRVEELDGETLEDKMKLLNELKKEYDHVRVIAKDIQDEDVAVMKSLLSKDENLKIDIKRKDLEDTVEPEYMFIINREYDLPTTIQKYSLLEYGVSIPISTINAILDPDKDVMESLTKDEETVEAV